MRALWRLVLALFRREPEPRPAHFVPCPRCGELVLTREGRAVFGHECRPRER